jgi:hypothetical protein
LPLKHPQLFRSVFIAIPVSIYAMLWVARPALVLTVVSVPLMYSISATSGGPYAAMPDKVTNNSPDNRTLNATARSRISLACQGNGGKAKDGRN